MHKKLKFVTPLFVVGFAASAYILLAGTSDSPKTEPPATPAASGVDNDSGASVTTESKPSQVIANSSDPPITTNVPTPQYPEKRQNNKTFLANGREYPLREYRSLITPNDPSYNQWWVPKTGLEAAWSYGTGSGTKIAIIDTGFALDHEEFANRWLDSAGEKGITTLESSIAANCTNRRLVLDKSCNGLDDDGNGYIDDARGWDFTNDDPSVQAGEINPSGSGVFHGTAVTGIAAATGNNGKGIAGVSWASQILPIQALGDDGYGDSLSIARAIRYAADRNVDVINLSLGSLDEDSYLREAIQYAMERDVIIVAASGNDGCDCISYPARYPEVVAVGALNNNDKVATFSSYGSNLDIIAPGSGMLAPSWRSTNATTAYDTGLAGTSFAAPYVSGLLANARSKQPNASWVQILNGLLQTADHRDLTTASPRSNTLGFGYVKADALMARASLAYNQVQRYGFAVRMASGKEQYDAIQCEGNQFPTAPFYEIRHGSSVHYSIDELAVRLQGRAGATANLKGYACTGFPTDQIDTYRMLNSAREFSDADANAHKIY